MEVGPIWSPILEGGGDMGSRAEIELLCWLYTGQGGSCIGDILRGQFLPTLRPSYVARATYKGTAITKNQVPCPLDEETEEVWQSQNSTEGFWRYLAFLFLSKFI